MTAASRTEDQKFMSLALALGRRGLGRTWPNPAVGALVVRRDGDRPVIVGRGWTQPGGRPHAETEALKRAGDAARGATLYVTLEPCSHHGKTPPCVDAIVTAGIARVVSALEDPNPKVGGEGHARLAAHGIKVETGVGWQEAERAHAGHLRRIRAGRPHVVLKLAISSDGKAGLAGGRMVMITGDRARERAHAMRAGNDAIMVGIGTALADDPQLTCRLPGMAARSPVRVVLDSNLTLPLAGRLVQSSRETPVWVIANGTADPATESALRAHGVEVLRVDAHNGKLRLDQALLALGERGITRLMVEGGPAVAASFVAADLVDEAVLFRSPNAIGPGGINALDGSPLEALTRSPQLRLAASETVGVDTVEHFERV